MPRRAVCAVVAVDILVCTTAGAASAFFFTVIEIVVVRYKTVGDSFVSNRAPLAIALAGFVLVLVALAAEQASGFIRVISCCGSAGGRRQVLSDCTQVAYGLARGCSVRAGRADRTVRF